MTMRRLIYLATLVPVLGASVLALSLLDFSEREAASQERAASRSSEAGRNVSTATLPEGIVTLRVDFRSKGKRNAKVKTVWDGQLEVSQGRVHRLRSWQDDPRNTIVGKSWKLTTRHAIPWNSQQRKRGHEAMPLKDAALVIELAEVNSETRLQFETVTGNFSMKISDVPLGTRKAYLGGLVSITRMANATTMLSAPSEDDFPAAALSPDGKLHVAYVAFTHGEGYRKRTWLTEPPRDFAPLARPTGGDQVLMLRLDDAGWTGPLPVTPPGQDIYRTALAISRSGTVWVFWSAARDGNWDLHARSLEGEKWSKPMRLTTAAGPDIFPVATTDTAGHVWVAWQGYRNGSMEILAYRQNGDQFGEPMTIASSKRNDWTPSIAAAPDGRVAIAWDTYDRGNYDIHCRIWKGNSFGDLIPIATTLRAEMRPSITFDAASRLWIAYEDAPEKWGKDQGALEKGGAGLYRGRSVKVRVWDRDKLHEPADDPINAFALGQQNRQRRTNTLRLAVPRLTTDTSGRVWLAVRSPRLGTRVSVGTTWFEHATWYEGDRWAREIICPDTDNLLDNRPALVPIPSGAIAMIIASDGRWATSGRLPQWFIRTLRKQGQKIQQRPLTPKWPDAVNNELTMVELGPLPAGKLPAPKLNPLPITRPAGPHPAGVKEAEDVARARSARVTTGGKTLRLWRGEFHRHTEISSDGGGDGLLLDMWRYGLDAADFDWIGNGDHDNGGGREYSWWITQKTTDVFHVTDTFTPMFTYERSVSYPDGHRNVVFDKRGIRTLPRLRGGMGVDMDDQGADAPRPNSPDTQLLYRYLAHFDGVCASHTSGTDMGTDWRDNDAKVEPIVEIYQGCRQNYEMPGAPRSNTAQHSLGGWRPFGFVSLALKKGFRLGFQSSSDHGSTHISYCNVWVEEPTRAGILAAMKARHIYGATDNIIATMRCGKYFMGDEFSTAVKPKLEIKLDGTQPFAKVHVIKDGNYVYSVEPGKRNVEFSWTDLEAKPGVTSYYYVRGEQQDGELVWVSPMWITMAKRQAKL